MTSKDIAKAVLVFLSAVWLVLILYIITRHDPDEDAPRLSPAVSGYAAPAASPSESNTYTGTSLTSHFATHAGVRSSVYARSSYVPSVPARKGAFASHFAPTAISAPSRSSSLPQYTGMGNGGGGGLTGGGSTGGSSGASGRGIRYSSGGVSMPMMSVSNPIAMASMPVAAREVENGTTADETYARIQRRVIIGGDDYDPDPGEDPLNPGKDHADPFFPPEGDAPLPLCLLARPWPLLTAAARRWKNGVIKR